MVDYYLDVWFLTMSRRYRNIFISYITSSLHKSLESANVFSNTATGAPYLRKFGNLAIREILVIS